MNREIKFRAWDECKKIMHHNFQFIKSGKEGNDWIIFTSDKQTLSDEQHPFQNPYFQLQLKIMQFTGLHDKNGKEIYEGDILATPKKDLFFHVYFGGNSFDGSLAAFSFKAKSGATYPIDKSIRSLEVIGNIYEHPELLNP